MSVKCPDVLWILLGIFAGLVLPVQTLVNTRLRASTGTPFSSSLISFAVGTMTLLVIATAVTGGEFGPRWEGLRSGPHPDEETTGYFQ